MDDGLQARDDELTRAALRDAFDPLPELQQEARTASAVQPEDTAPVRTDELSLRELLTERNARLTDRAADERSFSQHQAHEFERSVQAIKTFETQQGNSATFEKHGGIVDSQA